jgi:hypothetical protein
MANALVQLLQPGDYGRQVCYNISLFLYLYTFPALPCPTFRLPELSLESMSVLLPEQPVSLPSDVSFASGHFVLVDVAPECWYSILGL